MLCRGIGLAEAQNVERMKGKWEQACGYAPGTTLVTLPRKGRK